MKIVMIETGGWGGICHYTYNLANSLVRAGINDLTVISSCKYELEKLKRDFKLINLFNQEKGYISNILRLFNILIRERPSIIHIQSILSPRKDWLSFFIAKFFRMPIIYTVHNIFPHEEGEREAILIKDALRIIYKNSTKLIAHSESNKKELIEKFRIYPDNIKIVPHGNYLFLVPSEKITKEKARESLGLSVSDKILLSFGAIRRYKGIDYLIKAFKMVIEETPEAKLLIVGKPMAIRESSPVDSYYEMVERLGLKDKVLFYCKYIPLEEVHEYFISADVSVFPYLNTTESGSLQLAFAFSKPVIATRVGSFEEAIEEGKNGYLVPPEDEDSLAEAIIKILSLDRETLTKMGEYSRYIAKQRYNWEDIAKDTVKIYKGILNESS